MTDPIKIYIHHDEPVRSKLDAWASCYTSSEPLRKAIVKRTLLIAAFDDRFIDKTIEDPDLRDLLHHVAKDMLDEPPFPLTAGDDDQPVTLEE
jgi:hypothetical protein